MSIKTWSDEEEQELIRLYRDEEIHDVYLLADTFQKGYRSVISKLVQLRIYIKPVIEEEEKGHTVKVMLRYLEDILNIEIEGTNLNKKENLTKLVVALKGKLE